MNPEELLNDAAIAIKHRCISTTERWHLVYYHNRICCVPSYENVPPEIILIVFTDHQVGTGFTPKQWDVLKTNLLALYQELEK